jgi:DNA-binding protein H-NS
MPSSLGAEVPPPVHRLLASIQAPVSGPPVTPRRPLHVATLAASRRGPKRPLGQDPVSSLANNDHGPTWAGAARGPRAIDRVHGLFH